MKLEFIKPILKPSLILIILNAILCMLFGIAAALSIGFSWLFYAQFGLPFPLMPVTVIVFTLLSIGVWAIFARRLDLGSKERIATALAGVSPLIGIALVATLGALTFAGIPKEPGMAVLGPIATGFTAILAAAGCAACVVWIPSREAKPTGDSPG